VTVTRDVIHDLWPLYAAGEASADSHALVEEFLRQDPDFDRLLHERGEQDLLSQSVPIPRPDQGALALRRTKRRLHGWDWLLFLAILFSCFAFGRIISDTSWDVSPVNFIVMATIAGGCWIVFFTRLILVRRHVFRA
jgi:hypothetical protein